MESDEKTPKLSRDNLKEWSRKKRADNPCADGEKESIYELFDSYSFTGDAEFIAGWESVRRTLSGDSANLRDKFLDLKIFYFNRKFKSNIERELYLEWQNGLEATVAGSTEKSTSAIEKSTTSSREIINKIENLAVVDEVLSNVTSEHNSKIDSNRENVYTRESLNCDSFSSVDQLQNSKTVSMETVNETSEQKYPASFAEIMELVQKGEPIPGVEDLNIQPTNTEPTESNQPRAKKPWE